MVPFPCQDEATTLSHAVEWKASLVFNVASQSLMIEHPVERLLKHCFLLSLTGLILHLVCLLKSRRFTTSMKPRSSMMCCADFLCTLDCLNHSSSIASHRGGTHWNGERESSHCADCAMFVTSELSQCVIQLLSKEAAPHILNHCHCPSL